MNTNHYHRQINALLRDLPQLERTLEACDCERQKRALIRSLRKKEKQLTLALSYQELRQLHALCYQSGISATFI